MPLEDQIKNLTRKLVEDKPDEAALGRMVRKSTVTRLHFKDDGIIPNHPRWPLLLYRRSVMLAREGGIVPRMLTIVRTIVPSTCSPRT